MGQQISFTSKAENLNQVEVLINTVCKIFLRIPFTDFTSGIFLMKANIFYKTGMWLEREIEVVGY